jgi:ATP-dependent protease Clp ATPase subunit
VRLNSIRGDKPIAADAPTASKPTASKQGIACIDDVNKVKLPVIAPLDALGVDDLARILNQPKDLLIARLRKLVRFYGADLVFTDAAMKEVAKIALQRGKEARGLRSVIEEVLEGVLFDVEADVRYVITDKTVRGGGQAEHGVARSTAG